MHAAYVFTDNILQTGLNFLNLINLNHSKSVDIICYMEEMMRNVIHFRADSNGSSSQFISEKQKLLLFISQQFCKQFCYQLKSYALH